MDVPRESVALIVLIKPRGMVVRAQPIHICGRYRLVALTDNPVIMAAGASDAKQSE